ncbi:MAG: hypothetical protein JRN68_04765 [Nitrososphaerota archaeon]|nr:hypothetical protein [Nitrososphaerota archaeon]
MEAPIEPDNSWDETEVDPFSLTLDLQNSRLELPQDASQEEIRKTLIEEEDVISLAKSIVDMNGLLEGEKIILCREGKQLIVLEGNRRVCAVQLLLRPSLVPQEHRGSFPRVNGSSELPKRLSLIKAYIAPSRLSAEPIITSRHSDYGIRKWSRLAQMRRSYRRFNAGSDIATISKEFGQDIYKIERDIEDYKLYLRALQCKGLEPDEIDVMKDNRVEITKFTRFIRSRDGAESLLLSFDSKTHDPKTELHKKGFDAGLAFLIRAFLVNKELKRDPVFDTRTPIAEVKKRTRAIVSKFQEIEEEKKYTEIKKKEKMKKDTFFESLECNIRDDHLSSITFEIRNINFRRFPIAATMLFRALLEQTFIFQMKKMGIYEAFKKKHGSQVKLKDIFTYARGAGNKMFRDESILKVLQMISDAPRDYMNLVVHGKWVHANPDALKYYADHLRTVVKRILAGEDV